MRTEAQRTVLWVRLSMSGIEIYGRNLAWPVIIIAGFVLAGVVYVMRS